MTSSNARASGGSVSGDVKIAVVAARTIVGTAANIGSSDPSTHPRGPLVDWSPLCGLIAHATNALVNVVDPVTMQSVQVLDGGGRRSPVTRVRWARAPTPRHPADRMTLASADAAGNIVIWNVKAGEAKCTLSEAGSGKSSAAVADMEWLDNRWDSAGHLLAALHAPFTFVLWDTATGARVWRKAYAETVQGFDFDPFNAANVAFRCVECVLFVDDFHPWKAPTSAGKKFYVVGPPVAASEASASPARQPEVTSPGFAQSPLSGGPAEDKGKAARTKIKRFMKDLVSVQFL